MNTRRTLRELREALEDAATAVYVSTGKPKPSGRAAHAALVLLKGVNSMHRNERQIGPAWFAEIEEIRKEAARTFEGGDDGE